MENGAWKGPPIKMGSSASQHNFEFLFLDTREGKVCVAEIAAVAIASPCSYTRYRIASQEKILPPKPVRYVCVE